VGKSEVKKERVFSGIAASPGIAIGQILILEQNGSLLEAIPEKELTDTSVDDEEKRFIAALDKTRNDIEELKKRLKDTLQNSEITIFDSHLLIVDDQILATEVIDIIKNKNRTADSAFYSVINRYITAISGIDDQYIKERIDDIRDVASRIIANLSGHDRLVLDKLPGKRIIFAKELTPSDTALLDRKNVLGFALEAGTQTSHTSILARSMSLPAVVGLENLYTQLQDGDEIILDGFIGNLILNPSNKTKEIYAEKEQNAEKLYADLLKDSSLRPETIDGFSIQLAANIEDRADIREGKRYGAAGVGLFRTEFLYINAKVLPTEEELFNTFRQAATDLMGQPLIIRTLDIGGDKLSDILTPHHEHNPFLGLRAIRLCFEEPNIFSTQIRAILRASVFGKIKIMFPMITCMDELEEILRIIHKEKKSLKAKDIAFDNNIEVGIMIETPAAALLADALAKKVDFFSIGTNDLVQYTLAVDRSNERVAYLYRPLHPAILHLIDFVVKAAKRNHIWVSVCGEMAGDPRYTPILLGLGIDELSMSPASIGSIRRIIRKVRMYEAESLVKKALACNKAEDALELSEKLLYKIAPDIISLIGM
jgi:phosphotransferase system enzyme I (PtsI)